MSNIDMNESTPPAFRDPKLLLRIGYVASILAVVGAATIVKSVKNIVHR